MTLDEIKALTSPEVRPDGMAYEVYQKLCFKAGVSEPISKAGWSTLPIMDITKASEEASAEEEQDLLRACGDRYDLKKDDDTGDGEDDTDAGDETEEAEIDEDEEEEERGMDDISDKVEKGIEINDLLKAIDAYSVVEEALSKGGNSSREAYLQARLDAGTIQKSERVELGRIWAGTDEPEEPEELFQKSLSDTLEEDDNASQLVDASDFLRTLVKGVDVRMEQVLGEVNRDGRATRELLKAQGSLIKSLASHASQQDSIIKAMTDRLENVETAPVPRRAVTSRQERVRQRPLSKSIVGETDGEQMSKSQVTDALRALMIHASEKSDSSAMDRLSHATALYEQTGTLPQNVMQAVRQVS